MLRPRSPAPQTGSLPERSLVKLAEMIAAGDTAELIAAYSQARAHFPLFGRDGVRQLLKTLGDRFAVNIGPAEKWFQSYTYGGDTTDVIDPDDITFKQFAKRLHRYLLAQVTHKPANVPATDGEVSILRARVEVYESQIRSLINTVSERDTTISHLLRKVERYETSVQQLRESVSQLPKSTRKVLFSESHLTSSLASEEGSFRNESGRQIVAKRLSPTFHESLSTQSLFVGSTCGNRDKAAWQVSNSLRCSFKPKHVSAPESSIVAMLNARPQAASKPRTPTKLRKGGFFHQKSQPFRNVGRMMFANNL